MFGIFITGNPVSTRASNGGPQVTVPPHASTSVLLQDPGDACLAVLLCLPDRTPQSSDYEESLKAMLAGPIALPLELHPFRSPLLAPQHVVNVREARELTGPGTGISRRL